MLIWVAWEEEKGLGKQLKVNLEDQNDFCDHSSGGKNELKRSWDFLNIWGDL